MKYCIILLFFTFLSGEVSGQQAGSRGDTVITPGIVRPEYPGGPEELERYLMLNLHYPCDAIARKIEGEIMVSFTIENNGSVSDIKLLNTLGYGCEEEAERVIKNMPAWKPASRNGKAIAVQYKIPVVFELPL